MGLFASSKPATAKANKKMYSRAKRSPEEYQEVMDHLEEPDFNEDEILSLGEKLRERQRLA